MARRRLVGEHFNPSGKPKLTFKSERKAKDHVKARNLDARVYLCSFCNEWHFTNIKRRSR